MREHMLTPDNPLLSQVTNEPDEALRSKFAINCTNGMPDRVQMLVRDSLAENTRRAYIFDLAHFDAWGGRIPATPAMIATYLAEHAGTLAVATLVRRLASLSKAHRARSMPNPCSDELVKATMRGIRRQFGTAQREARPLLREDLFRALDALGSGVKDVRDRALLLLGFAGAFRRSELVGLDLSDIEHVRQGVIVTLRRSKTDQDGAGRKIGVPFGRTRFCPVQALVAWVEALEADAGALFRPIDRHGHIGPSHLSGDAVSTIVRERVAAAGLDPAGYSGHSLRAGFATSAAQVGVSSLKIRQQTGHASDAMLARYVRDGELFVGNAAAAVL